MAKKTNNGAELTKVLGIMQGMLELQSIVNNRMNYAEDEDWEEHFEYKANQLRKKVRKIGRKKN